MDFREGVDLSEVLKSGEKENSLNDLSSQSLNPVVSQTQSSSGSINPTSHSEQKDEEKLKPNPL